ncbi:hypothetical protein H1S01_16805 [Heliobacterium chlorum]|uniref:Uncharacterized protein n=1 Tax=Heliobacterium chlorum TaxID=2698 RepID=A0ABR7T8A0_HELCL|nr:CBO0543 family protein [Heliobacterium chlorum]MBC9786129.1 hypothetical protein [Heliobacterium chlorum]
MTYNDQLQAQVNLWHVNLSRWLSEELFSVSWWFLVGLTVISYIAWWLIVDKKSLRNILLFGSFIAVSNTVFDLSLVVMGLWGYKTKMMPTIPTLFPFDFTVIPLLAMTIYQFFPTWGKYFIGIAVTKGLFAFGAIPLLIRLQIMELHGIGLIYVYAVMLAIPLASKFVIERVIHAEHSAEAIKDKRELPFLTPVPAKRPHENDED